MDRRGVTPVVAVVILLMMTVALAMGAFAWMRTLQDDIQDEALRDLREEIAVQDLRCDVTAVAASLKNRGDTDLPAGDVDFYIYGPDGHLVTTRTDIDLSDAPFAQRGGFGTRGVFLNRSLVPGDPYDIEIVFDQADASLTHSCRADPGILLRNAIGNWDVSDGTTPDIESGSTGGCFYVVPSPIDNPINGSNVIKFNSSGGATCELQLTPRSGYSFEGAGEYRISADIWVGNAWDGNEQFLHTRWYDSGGELGTTGGGFPAEREEWEHIWTTFDTGANDPVDFNYYLGYPQQSTQGVAYVTNVRVARPPSYLR